MRTAVLVRIVVFVGLAAAVAATLLYLPWKEFLLELPELARASGPWGPVLYGTVYILACVMFVPGSLLTLGAGYTLGLLPGVITVSVASTIGASLVFLLSRFLLRDWVYQRVSHHPRFQGLDEAVRQQGFKIVLLVRLSPFLPFNVLNYMLGATKIAFRDFVVASWLGMLPATMVYVYLGTTIRGLTEELSGTVEENPIRRIFFWVGLAATIAVAVVITHAARKALKQAVPIGDEPSEPIDDI
jgi:uncharacterized membrane protein YdjX (TVP38/TMEM64 family)